MVTFQLIGMPTFPVEDGPPVFPDGEGGPVPMPGPIHMTGFFITNVQTFQIQASPFSLVRNNDLNVAAPPPGNTFWKGFD